MKFCPVCGKEYESGKVCDTDGAVLVEPKPVQIDSLVGQVLKESYRIEEKIGEGGMGAVFRGVQIALQRNVAIKVMVPGLQSAPTLIQRFFREAKVLSRLNHPNVVGIIDFGHTEDGMVYMVMEHLVGSTLTEQLPRGDGLDAPRIVSFMRQICSGVASAHRRQLVHRDLKPDNIYVTPTTGDESVKILDFGIARVLESENQPRLTQKGVLMGTPGFLAPEQIQSLDSDGRSDIYALGAILFFMITGRRPYAGDTPHAIFAQQLHRPPEIDRLAFGDKMPLADIVLRAMQIPPDDRFQSAEEMSAELESVAIATGLVDPPSRTVSTAYERPALEAELARDASEGTDRPAPAPGLAPEPRVEPTRMLRPDDSTRPSAAGASWLPWAVAGVLALALILVLLL